MSKKFKTFLSKDEKELNNEIDIWVKSINGVEVERSAPAITFSPYVNSTPVGSIGGQQVVAVTVAAEVKD